MMNQDEIEQAVEQAMRNLTQETRAEVEVAAAAEPIQLLKEHQRRYACQVAKEAADEKPMGKQSRYLRARFLLYSDRAERSFTRALALAEMGQDEAAELMKALDERAVEQAMAGRAVDSVGAAARVALRRRIRLAFGLATKE
jgi:hypothetical protein